MTKFSELSRQKKIDSLSAKIKQLRKADQNEPARILGLIQELANKGPKGPREWIMGHLGDGYDGPLGPKLHKAGGYLTCFTARQLKHLGLVVRGTFCHGTKSELVTYVTKGIKPNEEGAVALPLDPAYRRWCGGDKWAGVENPPKRVKQKKTTRRRKKKTKTTKKKTSSKKKTKKMSSAKKLKRLIHNEVESYTNSEEFQRKLDEKIDERVSSLLDSVSFTANL